MTDRDGHQDVRVGFHELRSLLKAIFANNRTSLETADILAEHCAGCERDGAVPVTNPIHLSHQNFPHRVHR
jgi:delta1-piperideine-2-carboxylate reductase